MTFVLPLYYTSEEDLWLVYSQTMGHVDTFLSLTNTKAPVTSSNLCSRTFESIIGCPMPPTALAPGTCDVPYSAESMHVGTATLVCSVYMYQVVEIHPPSPNVSGPNFVCLL